MAREVVRSLTTVFQQEGAEIVVQRTKEVKRNLQEAIAANERLSRPINMNARGIKSAAAAYGDVAANIVSSSQALKIYERDMKRVSDATARGIIGIQQAERQMRSIQSQYQNAGAPRGPDRDLLGINRRMGISDSAVSDARRFSREMEKEFAASERAYEKAFQTLVREEKEAERAMQAAASEAERMGARIRAIAGDMNPYVAAQNKLNASLDEYAQLQRAATTADERAILSRARLQAQSTYRGEVQGIDASRGRQPTQSFVDRNIIQTQRASAQASAEAFQEATRYESYLKGIIQEIDPLTAAQERLNAKLEEYANLRRQGLISDQQLSQGQVLAQKQYDYTARSIEGMADSTKLSSLELTNLQYQLNDIGVSLASGQSPFVVMMQQGAQIGQMFAPGSSLMGALKSVGSGIITFLMNPINLAVLGIALLAGAFTLVARAFKSNVEPIADALEKQRSAVADLTKEYDGMTEALERASKASEAVTQLRVESTTSRLSASAQKDLLGQFYNPSMSSLTNPIFTAEAGGRFGIGGGYEDFAEPLRKFGQGLQDGKADAVEFQDAIAEIANNDRFNEALQKAARTLLEMTDAAAEAQRGIQGLADVQQTLIDMQMEKVFEESFKGLKETIPDMETAEDRIKRLATAARENTRSRSDQLKVDLLEKEALDKLAQAEERRRAGYELDIRSISARSAQERALIAAEQERLKLADQNISAADKERRVQEVYNRTIAEGAYAWSEAMRARQQSREDTLAGLEMEARTLGMSESAAAAANFQFEQLAEAKRAANEAGEVVSAEEVANIEAAAARVGVLTAQIEASNKAKEQAKKLTDFAGDINFEMQQLGRSQVEQGIASRLRGVGLEYGSAQASMYEGQLRYIETVKQTNSALDDMRDAGKEAFSGLVDAISSGEGALEKLLNVFGRLNATFTASFFDQLFGPQGAGANIFGGGSASSGGGGIAGGLVAAAGALSSASSNLKSASGNITDTIGSAPVGAVTRSALPPIVTGEGFNASSARQVAGQSVPAQMWNFFAAKGLSSHQIAGIMGNAKAESAFNPAAVGDNGHAFGLFQWNDRGPAMKNFVGADWKTNVQGQLEFAWKELQTSESKAYRALLQATNVTEATEAFLHFERPSGYQTGVRNSHNYSGRVANANEQYRTFSNLSPEEAKKLLSDSTKTGVVSASQQIEQITPAGSGTVLGAMSRAGFLNSGAYANYDKFGIGLGSNGYAMGGQDPFTGYTPGSMPGGGGGFSLPGMGGGKGGGILSGFNGMTKPGSILGVNYPGFSAMGGLSAGLGGFSAGYSSGSPLGGGLQGGIGGFMAGGPVGGLIGLAGGILGGIFGGRAQRKKQHQEAAQKWAEMQPQYEAFKGALGDYGPNSGLLESSRAKRAEFDKFVTVGSAAWKMGTGNSSAEFESTANKIFAWEDRMRESFRDAFDPTLKELKSGFGFDGPFLKARDAVRQLEERIDTFIDDTNYAFSGNETAMHQARQASVEYALSTISGSESLSEMGSQIQELRGRAGSMSTILEKLGISAVDAANAIDRALIAGLDKLRKEFIQGLEADINEFAQKGYINEFDALFKSFEENLADAQSLGVDRGLVDRWFKTQAQGIVNNTDLDATGMEELIRLFPELAGVITTSMRVLEDAVSDAEADLREAYQKQKSEIENTIDRLKTLGDSITDFIKSIKLDSALSTLSPLERLQEAQKEFNETSEKALKGDAEAQEKIISVSEDYLNEAKSYYASSEGYFKIWEQVNKVLGQTKDYTVTQTTIEEANLIALNEQVGKLIDIDDSVKTVAEAIAALNAAQAARDAAQATALEGYVRAINPAAAAAPSYQAPQVAAPTPSGAAPGAANNNQPKAYANYRTASGATVRYEGTRKVVNGASIVVPDGMTDSQAWMLYARTQQYNNRNDMPGGRQAGGIIGYQAGGIVMNGTYNVDSVVARHANGEYVALAGGEHVTRASSVNSATRPFLDSINRSGQVPAGARSTVEIDIDGLRADLRALAQVVEASGSGTQDAIRETSEQARRKGATDARLGQRIAARG